MLALKRNLVLQQGDAGQASTFFHFSQRQPELGIQSAASLCQAPAFPCILPIGVFLLLYAIYTVLFFFLKKDLKSKSGFGGGGGFGVAFG